MKITSPTSFLSLETLYLVTTEHAHPGQPHTSWKYTPSPSTGWLVGENWAWDWNSLSWYSNTVVGMIPHHSNADPLPLRSSFLHGRKGLLDGQEHFGCGFQYKAAWVFPCASILPSQTRRLYAQCCGHWHRSQGVRVKGLASLQPPLGLGFLKGKTSVD